MNLKETFFTFIGMLVLVIAVNFVSAWGYQVFWNEVVLNIWQLFTTEDVLNTMRLSYWVCFVISFSIGLVWKRDSKETTENFAEAFGIVLGKSVTQLILIGLTIMLTSIIF
jgi:hypothetical protein